MELGYIPFVFNEIYNFDKKIPMGRPMYIALLSPVGTFLECDLQLSEVKLEETC